MNAIEIRLNPEFVGALLAAIKPALDDLDKRLAAPRQAPENDELMKEVWIGDLLESQREDVAAVTEIFNDTFMETGRAVIEPEKTDRVMRACSAIRLRLRETALGELSDELLEEGDFEEVEWTQSLRVAYGAYALFATLQELMVAQLTAESGDIPDDDEGEFRID